MTARLVKRVGVFETIVGGALHRTAMLRYTPDAPHTISLTLYPHGTGRTVVLHLSRDLVLHGCQRVVIGQPGGDHVRMWPVSAAVDWLRLTVRDTDTDPWRMFDLRLDEVTHFVAETMAAITPGAEPDRWDAALTDLLASHGGAR